MARGIPGTRKTQPVGHVVKTQLKGLQQVIARYAFFSVGRRELLRLLLQDHVDQQGAGRVGEVVHGSDGVVRSHKRDHMETGYQSVFGAVRVARTGYRQRGVSSVFPRDAQLNLPLQSYSHRLQKRVAAKAAKMSFESVAFGTLASARLRVSSRKASLRITTPLPSKVKT